MKRAEQRERTRGLILASARKLFLERGYERTTMRDIAATATRTTGSIFALYPDKASVFGAAMGHPAPDVRAFLASLSGLCEGYDSPHKKLAKIEKDAYQLLGDLYGCE